MVRKITEWEVLFPYLRDYQRSLILADFEKELERPHQTLKDYIEELVDENILRVERRERYSTYRLNLENPYLFDYLSLAEKLRTREVLKENKLIRRLYEEISPYFLQGNFLVFGSYAVDREGNDIDLLIVGDPSEELEQAAEEFGETYKDVHITEVKNREDLGESFKKEIHKKHIILSGSDYFVRVFGEMYGKTGLV